MAANYVLLEKIVVGAAGASSVTFSGIPQTGYTDLVVKTSGRSTSTTPDTVITFNGLTTNLSDRVLYSYTGSAGSNTSSTIRSAIDISTQTANTFANNEFYISNYASANYKSVSVDSTTESNDATNQFIYLTAGLWSSTAAITSITLTPYAANNFTQYSTFYLYGVAKYGTTPAIQPYATGGDTIMTDGTYWYHAFKANGTFTPAKGLSCDVLIAGGGGGASGVATTYVGAGGNAGTVTAWASQSFASGTGYTATVGAGGTGNSGAGSAGSTSSLSSLTAAGGAGGSATLTAGSCFAGSGAGGAGTGINTVSVGGPGTTSVTNWGALTTTLSTTGLGVSNYIAGGGGGGSSTGLTNAGGSGGGGTGQYSGTGTAGTANTGSGGGASNGGTGGTGGSGLVIVRYAV